MAINNNTIRFSGLKRINSNLALLEDVGADVHYITTIQANGIVIATED